MERFIVSTKCKVVVVVVAVVVVVVVMATLQHIYNGYCSICSVQSTFMNSLLFAIGCLPWYASHRIRATYM